MSSRSQSSIVLAAVLEIPRLAGGEVTCRSTDSGTELSGHGRYYRYFLISVVGLNGHHPIEEWAS
jgi:hypothetical protein